MNAPALPWPTFSEESVIEKLLTSSKAFQSFYHTQREKISKPLFWALDTTLPEGIDYRFTRLTSDDQLIRVIRLRRIPAILEDAIKIAHELEHIVLDEEGFPSTGTSSHELETLSSSLNSMIADPIVNSNLQKYGFDLWKDYQKEIKEDLRQLEKLSGMPVPRLGRLIWIFNYAGKMLDWELVRADKAHNEFQEWFNKRYPEIAERGTKLLERIKRVGYETPEQQFTLFKEVIQRNKLEGILTVRYFR